ncbi:hypothetical protein ABPG72_010492 [Tetrahymena utriculariae]
MYSKKQKANSQVVSSLESQDYYRIYSFLLEISFVNKPLTIAERSQLFTGILEVLDWAYQKKITQQELQILYQEWQKSKNILVENQQEQYIDLLASVEQCHLYFLQNFRNSEEISNRIQFYLDKLNNLYNQSLLDACLATKDQIIIIEDLYLKFDDQGYGFLYPYQMRILYQVLGPLLINNHHSHLSFTSNTKYQSEEIQSKIFKENNIKSCGQNQQESQKFQIFLKQFCSYDYKFPLKSYKNMMVNSFLNNDQINQAIESLNQIIEKMQTICITQQNSHNSQIKIETFNLIDPIFNSLFDQNMDITQKRSIYYTTTELVSFIYENDYVYKRECMDEHLASFLKAFIKRFMKLYQFCIGIEKVDINQEYISTNSNLSSKEFSQVYKKNPKFSKLNIMSQKHEKPPEIQKAFTFSQTKNHQSLENLNRDQNKSQSYLQKKYVFDFKFDENLLLNQSPPQTSKNNHLNRSLKIQQKPTSTVKKQIQNRHKAHQETIKHITTLDLSHLKSKLINDDLSPNNRNQQQLSFNKSTPKITSKSKTQIKSTSKSPMQSQNKLSTTSFNRLQEFSDQLVNTSLITKNDNFLNKENLNKNSSRNLQKDLSNLSLNIKSSKRSSQTPVKMSNIPSSVKALNFQKEQSKSPQVVRTHQQILKTKRIESYEKVMENLSNIQCLTPNNLTPRKQIKPFN